MIIARQSTARTVTVGPVLDADGAAVTDAAVGDFLIAKNGGSPGALNGSATLTHRNTGHYSLALTSSDLDTVGQVEIVINDGTNACPVKELSVVEEAVYDAFYASSAVGYVANAPVNVAQFGGTNGTFASGIPSVNAAQISGDSTAADNVELAFDDTAGPVPWFGIVDQGTAQSADSTGIVLRSAAAFADDTLIGCVVMAFGSNQGYWQTREITDNALSGDTVTVDPAWTVTPSGTITYKIFSCPRVLSALPSVNVAQFGGANGTFSGGRPEVNLSHIAGSAVSTSSAQLGVNVVNAGGTAWASGAITAAVIANGAIDAATFAADVGAEILSYLVDDATRIDASALNTASGRVATALPNVAPAGNGGLPTVDGNNRIVGIQGTITTLDALDSAQDSQHATSQGQILGVGNRLSGLVPIANTTIGDTGNSATAVHLAGLTYGDNELNGYGLVVFDASEGEFHFRWIEDWDSGSALATVATLPFTPEDDTDTYWLLTAQQVEGGSGASAADIAEAMFTHNAGSYASAHANSVVKQTADNAGGSSLTEQGIAEAVATNLFTFNTTKTYADAVGGSVVKEAADNAGGSSLTLEQIADAVWDEDATGHQTQGTFGQCIGDTTGSGVPILVRLPNAAAAAANGLPVLDVAGQVPANVVSMAKNVITANVLDSDAGTEIATAVWANATRTLSSAANITSTGGTITVSSGVVTASVTGLANNVITSSAIADGAITDVKAPALANLDAAVSTRATAAAVLAAGDVDGYSLEQTLKLCLAALVGKLSDAATTTITIQAADGSKPRIIAVCDADGNRTNVTLDATG